ncbi:MAG TPA: glycine betaine ABC transporter substrate-binding protein [Usitatibacteraceae bacterium]|nr:glycine betaine ABC transporter substrate-binding protein [Usitatibacteraceae bacterium]
MIILTAWRRALVLPIALFAGAGLAADAGALRVGSKRFTESYVLAEVVRQVAVGAGTAAEHRQGLGNTAIVLNALSAGSIDVYPEYSGTIAREILKLDSVPPLAELNRRLSPMGLVASVPLGFNNTYALAMRGERARQTGVTRLSDLKNHPGLRLGLTQEFIGRADGWAGLKAAYGLPWATPRGLDHGLAYEAIARGEVDVIDIYSTDAKIGAHQLVVLQDDAAYFPRYDALLLHKADLPARFPQAWAAIGTLEGRISEDAMRGMNAAAELEKKGFAEVAAAFLAQRAGAAGAGTPARELAVVRTGERGFWRALLGADLGRLAVEHCALVFLSLAVSVLIGIPLGVAAAKYPPLGAVILGTTGVLQTIPALALLAILIPLTGRIGFLPAFIALAIYALLPIVRNAHAGLTQIPRGMIQAAYSLGMTPRHTLMRVELPLARTTILAGIKTSAVIGVGTATIAAFIGAGGFGERIVTGLALNDHALLLAGAVPVAAMALLIEAGFGVVERVMAPQGQRRRVNG